MLDLEMPMALDRTSDLPLARWAVVRPLMNLPESRACALSDIARGCTQSASGLGPTVTNSVFAGAD